MKRKWQDFRLGEIEKLIDKRYLFPTETLECFYRIKRFVESPKQARPEEAVAEAKEDIEHTNRMVKIVNAAHADAKTKGLKKGVGGTSQLPCPSGCGGILQYSVASYNGHMHARCTTKNCASWME